MDNRIINQWRVTKYNPDLRDENGWYTLQEEWTCPSEIGKVFEGRIFTLEDYLRTESAYINAIVHFIHDSGINTLRILQLTKIDISESDKLSTLYEDDFDQLMLEEDWIVSEKEIRTIAKMVLRNFIWCQFYSSDTFFINFGWDYYMYIGSNNKCLSAIENAANAGLFVEEFSSPYYFTEEDTTRMIQWNEIVDDDKLIVGDEELGDIALDDYRKIFNLSEEHPVIGSFIITEEQSAFLQKFMKHKMDFSKYEYTFCGEC
ncbi:MAG: hypothetical protein RR595_11150 [Lysinibacillus sp.]